MISTVNTKKEQLENGYFKIDSGNEVILIVGSCRSVPYCNYLHEWNFNNNNRFTICFIDPFNWCFDLQDNRTDFESVINSLEKDERVLNLLKSVDIILHEYYSNFGMFNFSKAADKNIYQFGLNAAIDICIPNFNDLFILYSDIASFDVDAKKMALQDYNTTGKMSGQTKKHYFEISQTNMNKFYDVCLKSDLPEMKEYVSTQFRNIRFWWTYNHVSKWFTLAIFRLINDKFLKLDLSHDFWEKIKQEDMFANNYTKLSDIDIEAYGYAWNEEIVSLKDKIMG